MAGRVGRHPKPCPSPLPARPTPNSSLHAPRTCLDIPLHDWVGWVWDSGNPEKAWTPRGTQTSGTGKLRTDVKAAFSSQRELQCCISLAQALTTPHYKASPLLHLLVPLLSCLLALDETYHTNTLQCLSIGVTGAMVSSYRCVSFPFFVCSACSRCLALHNPA